MSRTEEEIEQDQKTCFECQKKWLDFYGDITFLYDKCKTCPIGVRSNKDDSIEVREAANKLRGWI